MKKPDLGLVARWKARFRASSQMKKPDLGLAARWESPI